MSLLTIAQQQLIKKISENNTQNYDQITKEVEEIELRDLLGIELLQDLQGNPSSTMNVRLLDEYSFENCNGNTIKHKGLRHVIAYFNYARYVNDSYIADTFTGIVEKNRQETTRASEGVLNRLRNESRRVAMKEWEVIKEYLDLNSDDYPLWDCVEDKQIFQPRFYFLRKTVN